MTTSTPNTSKPSHHQSERLLATRNVINQMKNNQTVLRDTWCLQDGAAQCLSVLTHLSKAKSVIEVGTSIGFSGLHLIEGMLYNTPEPKLHTIDASQERLTIARNHFIEASLTDGNEFELHQGDAITKLSEFCKQEIQVDMMFIDARKSEYIDYLNYAETLLKPGGAIIADNTESHQKQMANFLNEIDANPLWQTAHIPSWSGFTVSILKEDTTY